MDNMDPNVCCPQKAVQLNHSLTSTIWFYQIISIFSLYALGITDCVLCWFLWPCLWNVLLYMAGPHIKIISVRYVCIKKIGTGCPCGVLCRVSIVCLLYDGMYLVRFKTTMTSRLVLAKLGPYKLWQWLIICRNNIITSSNLDLWSTVSSGTHTSQSLQWRHNERDGVPNHQRPNWLLNHLFRRS